MCGESLVGAFSHSRFNLKACTKLTARALLIVGTPHCAVGMEALIRQL